MLNQSMSVLEAYHKTRTVLFNIESSHSANSIAVQLLKELREELAKLVPETFMYLYDSDRFVHLVRYIKAIAIRARRASVNFEKDQAKVKEVKFFTGSLNQLLQGLSASASAEKRRSIEDYFWLIEEYKVSVFAQELKTPVRVSRKRLKEKLKELERMV